MCKILVVTQFNLKNNFLYEIGLIAIREVSQPFDEERQYWRPYQPKHSPSSSSENVYFNLVARESINLHRILKNRPTKVTFSGSKFWCISQ